MQVRSMHREVGRPVAGLEVAEAQGPELAPIDRVAHPQLRRLRDDVRELEKTIKRIEEQQKAERKPE